MKITLDTTINELCQYCHQASIDGGWWHDEEGNKIDKPFTLLLGLILSELGEIIEADRRDKRADKVIVDNLLTEGHYSKEEWKSIFKSHIKDTVEDEIADTLIRVFDMCGSMTDNFDDFVSTKDVKTTRWGNIGSKSSEEDSKSEYVIAQTVYHIGSYLYTIEFLELIDSLVRLANMNNIDIAKFVELKLKFNKTRQKKHGKAY